MEENQPKIGKFSWTYGILGGVAVIVFSFMLYIIEADQQGLGVQAVGFLILTIAVILSIIQFKKANSGFISLSQGLKLGAGVGLVVGLLIVLYSVLFTYVIDPEYVAMLIEKAKQKAMVDNPQMTDEQWEVGMSIQKYVQYPAILIIDVVFGLIVGAITGAITKNNRPE